MIPGIILVEMFCLVLGGTLLGVYLAYCAMVRRISCG